MSKQKILTNLNLFKGDNDELINDATIFIDGNTIRYSGPSSGFNSSSNDFEVFDLKGKTVIPGMTESHAHLSYTNNGPLELDKTQLKKL